LKYVCSKIIKSTINIAYYRFPHPIVIILKLRSHKFIVILVATVRLNKLVQIF